MNWKKTVKKVGAVAAGTLLMGSTLGAAQLQDFPQPFVQDGALQSNVVVGSGAAQIDVVAAIDVATALGANLAQTEERSVDAEVVGGGATGVNSWSASNGVSLDTANNPLFFSDVLSKERDTLTSKHLGSLEDSTFTDDGGDETEVEYFLFPGDKMAEFTKHADFDNEDDPELVIDAPSDPSESDRLFGLEANFDDEINFTDSEVQGEDIRLFGNEYTVDESDTDANTLVLFGATQTLSLEDGESGTISIDESEHTIEVRAVNTDGVVYRVDGGNWEQDSDGDQFTVDGETVRIDNVINLNDDAGSADFEVGSEELRLEDGSQIEDADNNDFDGTHVQFLGSDSTTNGKVDELDGIRVNIGAEDDDRQYVLSGESYTHDLFGNYEFHFGGLNPDVRNDDGVGEEINFGTGSDETVNVEFANNNGETATVEFAHDADDDASTADATIALEDDDGDTVHVHEGSTIAGEDDYFVSDAGGFSHLWEVTNVDVDESVNGSVSSSDEATVDLQDVHSGTTVEVDLDANVTAGSTNNGREMYEGTEVIDGKTYAFELNGTGGNELYAAWGDSASVGGGNVGFDLDRGSEVTVYPGIDTETSAAVSLTEEVFIPHTNTTDQTYMLPTTESSDDKTVKLHVDDSDGTSFFTSGDASSGVSVSTTGTGDETANVTVQNGFTYQFLEDGTLGQVNVSVVDSSGVRQVNASALVIEPEDDNDEEHGYRMTPTQDLNDNEIDLDDTPPYTGSTRNTSTLESDDDITAGIDFYGAYTEGDSDPDRNDFTVWLPDGQATVGAAFTAPGGDLSATGGGSGSIEYNSPADGTYEAYVGAGSFSGQVGMLDSDDGVNAAKQNSHLILVGGPNANALVQELADDGATWTADRWADESDSTRGLIQYVSDAFSQGNAALVVAGYTGENTRATAQYLSNYESNALSGSQVTLSSAELPNTG